MDNIDDKDCSCITYDGAEGDSPPPETVKLPSLLTASRGVMVDFGKYKRARREAERGDALVLIGMVIAAFVVGYLIATMD